MRETFAPPLVGCSVSPDGRWGVLTGLTGFRVGPAQDLGAGRDHPLPFASRATFSADSRQVALATWNVGGSWDVEALISREER